MKKHGILHKSSKCDKCDLVTDKVHRRAGSKYHFFRCPKCLQQSSIRKNTILYNKSISLRSFLMLAYFFLSPSTSHTTSSFMKPTCLTMTMILMLLDLLDLALLYPVALRSTTQHSSGAVVMFTSSLMVMWLCHIRQTFLL